MAPPGQTAGSPQAAEICMPEARSQHHVTESKSWLACISDVQTSCQVQLLQGGQPPQAAQSLHNRQVTSVRSGCQAALLLPPRQIQRTE